MMMNYKNNNLGLIVTRQISSTNFRHALISDQAKINDLFDIIIDDVSLENEKKNLIIYKKALYNADKIEENQLLDIVKPIINSESVVDFL